MTAADPIDGVAVNSGAYNGMTTEQVKKKIVEDLQEKGIGKKAVNYKIRDWIFSRQRYWGEPIPLVHCPKDGIVAVPYDQLPLELPVSVPSELARQRPDILSAEALLHAASARVGVATANLYPQITLSGNVGTEALSPGRPGAQALS